MKTFKKKNIIKIPKNIQVIYCNKKNTVTFVGSLSTKSLKLKIKLFLVASLNLLVVSQLPVKEKSKMRVKDIKKIQGTAIAQIKQVLIEITYTLHTKLNLIGVGYRVFAYEKSANQIYLKLGYSHLIYFRVPVGLQAHCPNSTKLFLLGNGFRNLLTQTAAQIRNCKIPEPYKGKGILYDQEKISLKKGKKI